MVQASIICRARMSPASLSVEAGIPGNLGGGGGIIAITKVSDVVQRSLENKTVQFLADWLEIT
jgi:hypothetical protein